MVYLLSFIKLTESHKRELAVLEKTHLVKRDVQKADTEIRRRNFLYTCEAEVSVCLCVWLFFVRKHSFDIFTLFVRFFRFSIKDRINESNYLCSAATNIHYTLCASVFDSLISVYRVEKLRCNVENKHCWEIKQMPLKQLKRQRDKKR